MLAGVRIRSGRSQSRSSSYIAVSVAHWVSCSATLGPARAPSRRASTPTTRSPCRSSTDKRVRRRVIDLLVGEIIVTLTYVTLVMRADNDGGGSIMAFITLPRRYGGARGPRTARTLAALGLAGAALFFGETMITPAILAQVRSEQPEPSGAGGTRRRRSRC